MLVQNELSCHRLIMHLMTKALNYYGCSTDNNECMIHSVSLVVIAVSTVRRIQQHTEKEGKGKFLFAS